MDAIIRWNCACGKLLTAPAAAAGKKGRCVHCKAIVVVPSAAPGPAPVAAAAKALPAKPAASPPPLPRQVAASPPPLPSYHVPSDSCDDEFRLAPSAPRPEIEKPSDAMPVAARPAASRPAFAAPAAAKPAIPLRPIVLDRPRSSVREFAYLALILALIPLAIDTLTPKSESDSFGSRLAATALAHPEITPKLHDWATRAQARKADFEELFTILPDHEVDGAFLPRDSHFHWMLALAAAAVFFLLLLALFPAANVNRFLLAGIGLLTATVGVLLLIGFQLAADWTRGHYFVGRSIIVVIFYIVKFIGFSYDCANDPNTGFLLSFFGFTMGVGLCEEICKAMPLMVWVHQFDGNRRAPTNTWRNACLLGMASGVGFGIAEGIMYSGQHYNGMSSGMIYLVRFASCVTLHAVWAGSVGIMMFKRQDALHACEKWYEYLLQLVITISIPMTLHGLYDTLFKKEMPALALAVAVASFAWLAVLVESMRHADLAAKPLRTAASMA